MRSGADAGPRVSFDRSLLPMMMNSQRRYTNANAAACLFMRLGRERLLALRLDDLTPPEHLPQLELLWSELLSSGTQAGAYEFLMPCGRRLRIGYSATALRGSERHVGIVDPNPSDFACSGANASAARDEHLSVREREIIARVAMGDPPQVIADELSISSAAVEGYIGECLIKLHASNQSQAVLLAIRRGEIQPF